MSTGQTGKSRASRIPLDYYKHPNRLERWKQLLALGGLGVAVVWVGSMFGFGGKTANRFSHGACARAHQPIEHDCSSCHVNFAVFSGKETFNKDSATKCGSCHLDGGHAAHHTNQKDGSTPNCGSCHTDHKGLERDLNRMPDSQCTTCHANMDGHADKLKGYDKVIKSFVDGHQEFRMLRGGKPTDPGKIKFSHHYHMTPGIILTAGSKPFTLADMPPEFRAQYRKSGQADSAPVEMDCKHCHTADAGKTYVAPTAGLSDGEREKSREFFNVTKRKDRWFEEKAAGITDPQKLLLPARKPDAYLAPVNYEKHCAACHQLDFDRGPQGKLVLAPHRQTATELKSFVVGHYADVPPPRTETLDPLKNVTAMFGARPSPFSNRADVTFGALMQGKCSKCHLDDAGGNVSLDTAKIAPAAIPSVWYRHSRFDHGKHAEKGIDCRKCHDAAYAKPGMDLSGAYSSDGRQGAEAVMLPGIDNCKECHSPSPKIDRAEWRAKHDCTECHNYHHGAGR